MEFGGARRKSPVPTGCLRPAAMMFFPTAALRYLEGALAGPAMRKSSAPVGPIHEMKVIPSWI